MCQARETAPVLYLLLQLNQANKGISSGGSSVKAAAPMSLLPVLIVGLLAFLIGHYLQNIPVISKLLGKH